MGYTSNHAQSELSKLTGDPPEKKKKSYVVSDRGSIQGTQYIKKVPKKKEKYNIKGTKIQ
jgi:hypothetical protein